MTRRKIVLTIAMLILSIQIADFAQGKDKPDPIADLQNQINDLQQQINSIRSPRMLHGIVSEDGARYERGGGGDWSASRDDSTDPDSTLYNVSLNGFLRYNQGGSHPTCIAQQLTTGHWFREYPMPHISFASYISVDTAGVYYIQILSTFQSSYDLNTHGPYPQSFVFTCVQE